MSKIGFWKTNEKYGEFSNWYTRSSFIYKERRFSSSEQALMWEKAQTFKDEEIALSIMANSDPKKIKKLGRQVANYDDKIWRSRRGKVMFDILLCKFSQDLYLKQLLLSTGDSELFEASPIDNIWGIGSSDVNIVRGGNLLGITLMRVREELRKEGEVS